MDKMEKIFDNGKKINVIKDVADEMLAILSDRNRIMQKKDLEAVNARWNEMTYNGFPGDEE